MIAQITSIGHIQTNRIPKKIKISQPSPITKKTSSLIPYFERNNFLKEQVTAEELASIHKLGLIKITKEDLQETKAAVNVISYDPASKLINLMIENDILAFSRTGLNSHPHLVFLTTLLPRIRKEAGATHLALALPRSLQKLLDVFQITGEFFANLSPLDLAEYGLTGKNDFIELLKTARLAGYQLVAVESDSPVIAFNPEYDQRMALRIMTVLEVEERAKVIFIAPDRHLSYEPIGDWLSASAVLKEAGVKIRTINQFWHSEFIPKVLNCLLQGLTRPLALASKDVKMFAALQSRALPIEHIFPSNWDLTIIYPRLSSKTTNFKHTLINLSNALGKIFSSKQ